MNILQFLKNGSGIHIKKENRGKFTDYCGGKVTSECIAKGKRSSNPAIRKRATFAANARKWKHENGGKVKKHQAFVNGVSILDSNPDAYKYVKKKLHKAADGGTTGNWISKIGNFMNSGVGQSITNIATQIPQIIQSNKQLTNYGEQEKAQNKASLSEMLMAANQQAQLIQNYEREKWKEDYLNGKTLDKSFESEAVTNARKNQILSPLVAKAKNTVDEKNKLIDAAIQDQKSTNWGKFIFDSTQSLLGTGMGMLGNKGTTSTSSAPGGTTTTSYASYAPSYTPSMPKTFSEYVAINYKK